VRNGEETILFLQTGQVFHTKPDAARFGRAAKQLAGLGIDAASVRELYFKTRVVPAKEYAGAVTLLGIFALQLSALGNQMALQRRHSEFEPVTRAKEYINSHQMEELSLGAVAKAVHMSTFYFCKMFKKSTGLNFSDYVRRLRTEKAKNLLLNRNLRVSEIAYAIGFQSLTNFNRTFRLIVGKSPTEYRANFAVLSAA
jgi:AraC-like DNA-binding protein